MPSYDYSKYNAPAPVASVILRNPETGVTIADQHLLIDSVIADATLLPRAVVESIGIALLPGEQYEVMGF